MTQDNITEMIWDTFRRTYFPGKTMPKETEMTD